MSLRLRLLLSLLALAAVGLVIVDAVSYSSLRSHLSQRVDQQVESARAPATIALLVRPGAKQVRQSVRGRLRQAAGLHVSGGAELHVGPGPGPAFQLPPPGARSGERFTQPAPGPGAGAAPGPPPAGAPPEGFQLPPGTYGLLKNARGKTVSHISFSYGESGLPAPTLPKQVPLSSLGGNAETFTVGAAGGASTQFRAVAFHPAGTSATAIVAVPLNDFEDTLHHVALIGAIVTAAVLIGLAVLAWWLIGVDLRPLQTMGETAGRIADGDLSQRVEVANQRTEVGRLGQSLNSMLGQIEDAFAQREASEQRMRRFLADASHELRTPLTSIRGYAELFRLGMASDPGELRKAMQRIEDESARMGGIVNDLLSLARLDEVREPRREPVDLRELAQEACDDARAAHSGREIELTATGPVEVLGDPDQLRQVVTNLLANATDHTPQGTPVEVSLGTEAGEAVLTVRDHGPGLSAEGKQQVFERFWRESESRGRESGGAGLGLAIVAAIVKAHGGSARADNHPEGGAVFTVRLPVRVKAAVG
jgi:two-component system OmpR family sensor kinase